jgi:hypothetical protein
MADLNLQNFPLSVVDCIDYHERVVNYAVTGFQLPDGFPLTDMTDIHFSVQQRFGCNRDRPRRRNTL